MLIRPASLPAWLLRLEGAATCAAAIALYFNQSGKWWLFLALILAPDLSMLGYLAGPRTGSVVYNVIHNHLLPGALIVGALFSGITPLLHVGLIWMAHIGADRLLGFGLKYPTGFKDNHLGRV